VRRNVACVRRGEVMTAARRVDQQTEIAPHQHEGRVCGVTPKRLREIQATYTKGKKWRAPFVADLISRGVYDTHFACDEGGKLYVYRDGVYCSDGDDEIRRLVKAVVPKPNWTVRLANETNEYLAADCCKLWLRPPLDSLNLQNGLLDLRTRRLRAHSAKYLSTVQIPVSFNPKATCPAWDKQIAETFPADAIAAGVAFQIVAWLMIPLTGTQKALLLIGPGGSGKSTFLRALISFLGRQNVSSVSLQSLERERFAASRLVGRLANICADLPSTHLDSSAVFKMITGGDQCSAEYKFRDIFEFTPFARLIFSANTLPVSKDAGEAFYGRWITLPFEHVYRGTTKEADRHDLDARLASPDELSGVLNKALDLLPDVRRHGITVTRSMQKAHDDFRRITNPFSMWIAQVTVIDPAAWTPKRCVITSYNSYLSRQGRPTESDKAIGMMFKRTLPHMKEAQRSVDGQEGVWCYLGLRLKSEDGTGDSRGRDFRLTR
jgi:putative DNA primase/helicase